MPKTYLILGIYCPRIPAYREMLYFWKYIATVSTKVRIKVFVTNSSKIDSIFDLRCLYRVLDMKFTVNFTCTRMII